MLPDLDSMDLLSSDLDSGDIFTPYIDFKRHYQSDIKNSHRMLKFFLEGNRDKL